MSKTKPALTVVPPSPLKGTTPKFTKPRSRIATPKKGATQLDETILYTDETPLQQTKSTPSTQQPSQSPVQKLPPVSASQLVSPAIASSQFQSPRLPSPYSRSTPATQEASQIIESQTPPQSAEVYRASPEILLTSSSGEEEEDEAESQRKEEGEDEEEEELFDQDMYLTQESMKESQQSPTMSDEAISSQGRRMTRDRRSQLAPRKLLASEDEGQEKTKRQEQEQSKEKANLKEKEGDKAQGGKGAKRVARRTKSKKKQDEDNQDKGDSVLGKRKEPEGEEEIQPKKSTPAKGATPTTTTKQPTPSAKKQTTTTTTTIPTTTTTTTISAKPKRVAKRRKTVELNVDAIRRDLLRSEIDRLGFCCNASEEEVLHALWIFSGDVAKASDFLLGKVTGRPWGKKEDAALKNNQNVAGLIARRGRINVINRLHFLNN